MSRSRASGSGFRFLIPLLLCSALWTFPVSPALARRGVRPLFEPTDLELETTGTVEIDVQVGAIQSRGPARVVVPDVEVDVGLLPNLELDLDADYAIQGAADAPFSFDYPAPDDLWVAAKIGLFDWNDEDTHRSWALGFQLGPKFPVAGGARGIGGELLFLIGHSRGATHLVLNAGAFADPHPDASTPRPVGLEVGLDIQRDLDAAGRFSVTGELSGVGFVSPDPAQLMATAGLTFSASEDLDLSLVGLVGFLQGSDRYGVLLGVSPKLHFR
jgi:hypothetical protein